MVRIRFGQPRSDLFRHHVELACAITRRVSLAQVHLAAAFHFDLAANCLPKAADLLYGSECERLFGQRASLGEELANVLIPRISSYFRIVRLLWILAWYQAKVADRGVKDIKYFLVALAALQGARAQLDPLGVTYHAGVWLEKGLSDFLTGDALTKAKADIRALEAKLHETWKGRPLSLFSFGYGKSEALFYLEPYNVPNNVFPVLWWPPLKNNTDRRVVLKRLAP